MSKEKKILLYFICFLLGLFTTMLIGISDVFAATYTPVNYKAQLYDNINGSLSSVTTDLENNEFYYGFIGLTAYTSGGAWGVSSPIPLIANHTYSMTVDPYVPGCGFTILSTVNRIGVGTSLSNAKSSYENNTNVTEKFSQAISNSRYLQYVFTPTINASYIVFPYATTSTCNSTENQLSNIVIEDLGESSISQDQINTSLNNQTNEINNSINNSTDTITGAITDVEDSINNTIKDELNSCRDSYNLLYTPYTVDNKLTDTSISDDHFVILNYYATLEAGKTYTFSVETDGAWGTVHGSDTVELFLLKDKAYTNIVGISFNPFTFTVPETGNYYLRYDINQNAKTHSFWNFQIVEGSSSKKWEQAGVQVCQNKIDETNDKLDETNQNLGDIKDSLTDSSSPDIGGLSDSAGWLPPGPLDSVLNLPLSLFNSLTTNLNKSCSPISIPLPYVNKNLTIPCINTLYDKIGVSTFITWLGVIVSGLMLYTYLLKLYKWIEDRISLNETHSVDNWGGL